MWEQSPATSAARPARLWGLPSQFETFSWSSSCCVCNGDTLTYEETHTHVHKFPALSFPSFKPSIITHTDTFLLCNNISIFLSILKIHTGFHTGKCTKVSELKKVSIHTKTHFLVCILSSHNTMQKENGGTIHIRKKNENNLIHILKNILLFPCELESTLAFIVTALSQ